MAKNTINIGRGPKSAVDAAIESKQLGPLDLVVTKEADGKDGELILVDEDSSQVVVTPRTQKDIEVSGHIGAALKNARTLPAGTSLDEFAEALLVNATASSVIFNAPVIDSVYKENEYGDLVRTIYKTDDSDIVLGDILDGNNVVEYCIDAPSDVKSGSIYLDGKETHRIFIVNGDPDFKLIESMKIPGTVHKSVIEAVIVSTDGERTHSNKIFIDVKLPEVFSDFSTAEAFASTSVDAYEGLTIKVKNDDGSIGVYTLETSTKEGKNFKLTAMATASGADGVKSVAASEKGANRIIVQSTEGTETKSKVVSIPGAVYEPSFDSDSKELKFKRATDANETGENDEVVSIDLSSLSDDHTAVTNVEFVDGSGLDITKHTAESEKEDEVIHVPVGNVTSVGVEFTAEEGSGATVPQLVTHRVLHNGTKYYDTTSAATLSSMAYNPKFSAENNTFEVSYADQDGIQKTIVLDLKSVIPTGAVSNPSYDTETRTITLPVQKEDGTAENLVIALGKDLVTKSGRYDDTTKEIILVLSDDQEVKIPAASLVDVYTGKETKTARVSVSDTNEISVDVKIAARANGNLVKVDNSEENGGIYVDPSDFATDEKTIESITQIVTEKVIGEIVEPVEPDPENPDAPTTQPVKVKDYVDNTINNATGLEGVTDEEGNQMTVKDYVDSQTLQITSKFVNFGASTNEQEITE